MHVCQIVIIVIDVCQKIQRIHLSGSFLGNLVASVHMICTFLRVSQGFWGTREHWQNIEGNKGTLANFWEQGTKFRKITVRKHSERAWEYGNIGQFCKGTREQGPPPGRPSTLSSSSSFTSS